MGQLDPPTNKRNLEKSSRYLCREILLWTTRPLWKSPPPAEPTRGENEAAITVTERWQSARPTRSGPPPARLALTRDRGARPARPRSRFKGMERRGQWFPQPDRQTPPERLSASHSGISGGWSRMGGKPPIPRVLSGLLPLAAPARLRNIAASGAGGVVSPGRLSRPLSHR